jgi:hypothetical protein
VIDVRSVDVVVMGGGPAGSVTAALLAQAGASVVLVERERFPRLHPGEGIAPGSLAVLDGLDLRAPLADRYTLRGGTRVTCARTGRTQRFAYDDAYADLGPGFIAPRAHLDDALLRRAAELGAEVLTPASIEDVLFEGGRARGVRISSPTAPAWASSRGSSSTPRGRSLSSPAASTPASPSRVSTARRCSRGGSTPPGARATKRATSRPWSPPTGGSGTRPSRAW